jgi:cation:H+ antiporter
MFVSPPVATGLLLVGGVAALWAGRRLSRPEGLLLALSEGVRWTLSLLCVLG